MIFKNKKGLKTRTAITYKELTQTARANILDKQEAGNFCAAGAKNQFFTERRNTRAISFTSNTLHEVNVFETIN